MVALLAAPPPKARTAAEDAIPAQFWPGGLVSGPIQHELFRENRVAGAEMDAFLEKLAARDAAKKKAKGSKAKGKAEG